jgi:hypothetical protein
MSVAAYECVPVKGLLRKVVTIDFTATLISQPRLEDRGVLRRQRGSQNKGAQVNLRLGLDE